MALALTMNMVAAHVATCRGRTFYVPARPLPRRASIAWCADSVQRFDFTNYSEAAFRRFAACLDRRAELPDWHSAEGFATLSGEHYPVLVAPSRQSPPSYWVLPAWDYVVSNAVRREGTFEPAELELFRVLSKKGDTVLDIGAHVGSYTVPVASRLGTEGTVHAFEPFRLVAQILTANVAINGLSNVFVHQVALGSSSGTRRVKSPALSRANNVGATGVFSQAPQQWTHEHVLQYDGEEIVHISTLDSFEFENVALLKVDVEGDLQQVLEGAQNTFERCRPILIAEHFGVGAPAAIRGWNYHCLEFLKSHWLWVCVPLEKWSEYFWLEPLAQAMRASRR